MLSICVPTYAFDVRPFIQVLRQQASQLSIPWEIIVVDDGSPGEWGEINASVGKLKGVHYQRQPLNLGRAAIRNLLAELAQYEYLLLLDNDGWPERENFLKRYLAELPFEGIVYGGRTYAPTPPANSTLLLHWHYGTQREVRSAESRREDPYFGFMTNNFCVPRMLLLANPFEEKINSYGHEDTLFGWQLAQQNIPIKHIDNPVRHIGLEAAAGWLNKQQVAVTNLKGLLNIYPSIDTKSLRLYRWIKTLRLNGTVRALLRPFAERWFQQLENNSPPKLWQLDALKLYWLVRE